MINENVSLVRQMDIVFKEINEELTGLSSGIVFIQIRNNIVGKFGVRHDPIESKDGELKDTMPGLSEIQLRIFRQMGIRSLKHKKNWTHGEILFEFALQKNTLLTSIQFESHYNMSNLIGKFNNRQYQREIPSD